MASIRNYKDLIVWQKSIQLVLLIYKLTHQFPPEERFGIISQMRRASVSIPSNIAEGWAKRSLRDYSQSFSIAFGSSLELETQLIISKKLDLTKQEKFIECEELLLEVIKMLHAMTNTMKNKEKKVTI